MSGTRDGYVNPEQRLKDAGLARVTLVHLAANGGLVTVCRVVPQETLARVLDVLDREDV